MRTQAQEKVPWSFLIGPNSNPLPAFPVSVLGMVGTWGLSRHNHQCSSAMNFTHLHVNNDRKDTQGAQVWARDTPGKASSTLNGASWHESRYVTRKHFNRRKWWKKYWKVNFKKIALKKISGFIMGKALYLMQKMWKSDTTVSYK